MNVNFSIGENAFQAILNDDFAFFIPTARAIEINFRLLFEVNNSFKGFIDFLFDLITRVKNWIETHGVEAGFLFT